MRYLVLFIVIAFIMWYIYINRYVREEVVMNMIGIKCPHCGADLKINDEIDMFYCNFCGGQIFMDGLSDAAYESRTKIKAWSIKR